MSEVYVSYGCPPGIPTEVYHAREDCSRMRAKPISWDLDFCREIFPRLRPCKVCHKKANAQAAKKGDGHAQESH